MLRESLIAVALAGLSGIAIAAVELPEFPQDAENEQDARVQAYYKAQCENYAEGLKIGAGERDQYVKQCLQDMAAMLPVGLEPDEKGDEG
jgi:hypothetical protein